MTAMLGKRLETIARQIVPEPRLQPAATYMPVDFRRDVHCLLGLPFDAVDLPQAVERLRHSVRQRSRCVLSTPNLNFLVACRADHDFRRSVITSELCIADGMPLVWIAQFLGVPIKRRVAGSCVFEALRNDDADRLSVYFLGGPAGVAEAAANAINTKPQVMTCVGFENPGYGPVEEISSDVTIRRINASGADFLVVALGAKKGQAWIERNRSRLDVPLISHLGAVVNFVAGTVKRAPRWMQWSGLEWLWRIKEEPALWRRYFVDGLALGRLLFASVLPLAWYQFRHPLARKDLDAAGLCIRTDDKSIVIELSGAWGAGNLDPLRDCFTAAGRTKADIRLDLTKVAGIDSAFIGLLMLLYSHQAMVGARLGVVGAGRETRRVIELSCAGFVFEDVPSVALRSLRTSAEFG